MSYTLNLTAYELNSLAWFADRGYDCGLYDALEAQNDNPEPEDIVTYTIPEHQAWKVAEQAKEHGAWACLAWDSPLGEKISAFLESIV